MKKIWFSLIACTITFWACDKKESEIPPAIETVSVEAINSSTIKVTGTVDQVGNLPVSDYGFVYGYNDYLTVESGIKVSLGKNPTQGSITKEIPITTSYGHVRMYLTNSKGTAYGNPLVFYVPSPGITNIVPASAKMGDEIKIYGSNFGSSVSENIVLFGNAQATVLSADPNVLTVKVPDCFSWIGYDGNVTISVSVSGKQIQTSLFKLLATITDYNPKNGGFGTTVTITGRDFKNTYYGGINFGNLYAYCTYVNANTIKVDVPAGIKSKSVPITFIANGTSQVIGNFTMDPPIIESFSPETGIAGLTKLQVQGNNFNNSGGNILKIGNTEMENVYTDYSDFGKINKYIPQTLTPGNYDLSVFNGIEWVTAATKLNIVLPQVTSISPETGYVGDQITLTANFLDCLKENNYAYLIFSNAMGARLYSNYITMVGTEQQITVTVPAMASGTYDLSVFIHSTDYNRNDIEVPTSFQFTIKPPLITGFNPTSGYSGDEITIMGENLIDSEVLFGTVDARILSRTPTEIKVQIPNGIDGRMKISIVIYGQTIISENNFTVLK